MNKLTEMALERNADGMADRDIINGVLDETMQELIEGYGIELNSADEAKLEMLLRAGIIDGIEWEVLENVNRESADYADAKRSAIYR